MALAAGTYAVFTTTEGKITVRLFESDAPITVKNFIELAEGSKAVSYTHLWVVHSQQRAGFQLRRLINEDAVGIPLEMCIRDR